MRRSGSEFGKESGSRKRINRAKNNEIWIRSYADNLRLLTGERKVLSRIPIWR